MAEWLYYNNTSLEFSGNKVEPPPSVSDNRSNESGSSTTTDSTELARTMSA